MTITSSASASISALFGAVTTVAHTASRSVTTAAATLDMLDTYVGEARDNQRHASTIRKHRYLENLIKEQAADQAELDEQIRQRVGSNPRIAADFNANLARYQSLFTETQP